MVRAILLAASAIVLVTLATSPPASAGVWIIAKGCDTLSTRPLRILDRFKMFDRFTTTFCSAQLQPTSQLGSALVPILGCVSPPNLSCELDSLSGVATFSAIPCVNVFGWVYGYPDSSLGVIVDSPNACFLATYVTSYGPFDDSNVICFTMPCSSDPTPTTPETWGRLKAAYR